MAGARLRASVAGALLLLGAAAAQACSPKPGWKPPTPEEAFDAAAVVVHARVTTVNSGPFSSVATLADVRALKGEPIATARTMPGAQCGIGRFEPGSEVVLFLPSADAPVLFLQQPREADPERVLEALREAGKIR